MYSYYVFKLILPSVIAWDKAKTEMVNPTNMRKFRALTSQNTKRKKKLISQRNRNSHSKLPFKIFIRIFLSSFWTHPSYSNSLEYGKDRNDDSDKYHPWVLQESDIFHFIWPYSYYQAINIGTYNRFGPGLMLLFCSLYMVQLNYSLCGPENQVGNKISEYNTRV